MHQRHVDKYLSVSLARQQNPTVPLETSFFTLHNNRQFSQDALSLLTLIHSFRHCRNKVAYFQIL